METEPTNGEAPGTTLAKRDIISELTTLLQRMESAPTVSPEDEQRYKEIVLANPKLWPAVETSVSSVERTLIEKMCPNDNGAQRAYLEAEMDILRKRFRYDEAQTLERLLVDQIALARLRVIWAEGRYSAQLSSPDSSIRVARFWDDAVSSAHSRFRRAVESLARIQRLGAVTPGVQINIAGGGGQQVNVNGPVQATKAADAPACHTQ